MFLYLLQFKNLPSYFKIGITTNVLNRTTSLVSTWGELDIDNSFIFTSSNNKSIRIIEKELHLIFPKCEDFELQYKGKDGYSEFRHLEHLDECLDIILNQKHSSFGFVKESLRDYGVRDCEPIEGDTLEDMFDSLIKKASRKKPVTERMLVEQRIIKKIDTYSKILDKVSYIEHIYNDLYELTFRINPLDMQLKVSEHHENTFGVVLCQKYNNKIEKLLFKTVEHNNIKWFQDCDGEYKMYQNINTKLAQFNKKLNTLTKFNGNHFIRQLNRLVEKCNRIHVTHQNVDYVIFHLTFNNNLVLPSEAHRFTYNILKSNYSCEVGMTQSELYESSHYLKSCIIRFKIDINSITGLFDSNKNEYTLDERFKGNYTDLIKQYWNKSCPF